MNENERDLSDKQYLQEKISMIQQQSIRMKQENDNERDAKINSLKDVYAKNIKDLNQEIIDLKQKCDLKIRILSEEYESRNMKIEDDTKRKIKCLQTEYEQFKTSKIEKSQNHRKQRLSLINIGVNDDIYNSVEVESESTTNTPSMSQQQHSNNIMSQKWNQKNKIYESLDKIPRKRKRERKDLSFNNQREPKRKKRRQSLTHSIYLSPDIIKEVPGFKRNRIYASRNKFKSKDKIKQQRKRRKTMISRRISTKIEMDNKSHCSYDGDTEYEMTKLMKSSKNRHRASLIFTNVGDHGVDDHIVGDDDHTSLIT